MADQERRLGESLKIAIELGERSAESLSDDQRRSLAAAGWEVTADGQVVAYGTATAKPRLGLVVAIIATVAVLLQTRERRPP
jgi:hypothetical protein